MLLTYLLTPWSRVLLEKVVKLVKKFPAFYGTRRFITAFTSARHMPPSWTSSIQSIPPRYIFYCILCIHIHFFWQGVWSFYQTLKRFHDTKKAKIHWPGECLGDGKCNSLLVGKKSWWIVLTIVIWIQSQDASVSDIRPYGCVAR